MSANQFMWAVAVGVVSALVVEQLKRVVMK
jgi:hypothetical protein